jgi:hypothetical protein
MIVAADKLVKPPANKKNNYWSPLSCLVEEQEEEDDEPPISEHMCSATADDSKPKVKNNIAEKWKRKTAN